MTLSVILLSMLMMILPLLWAWSGIWSVATASELESDLLDTGLGQEVACWFQCWKTQLVSFDQSNNTGANVKIDGSILEEKSYLKMLRLTFSSKWIGALKHFLYCENCIQENWSLDVFYAVSFSWGCPVSLSMYHTAMHRVLL